MNGAKKAETAIVTAAYAALVLCIATVVIGSVSPLVA